LSAIGTNQPGIIRVFEREAGHAMILKNLEL